MPTTRYIAHILLRYLKGFAPAALGVFCFMTPVLSQVFYTVDFVADQANWESSGDCGNVFTGWLSYPPSENVVDIQSNSMAFIDLEGAGCDPNCPGGFPGGGDLENFYTTDPLDISGKCQVQINVDFSFFNDTTIPGPYGFECTPGCGEDWLSFEYAVDGGAFQYFDPSVDNEFCNTSYDTGDSDSVSSDLFSGTDVQIRIQVGSQAVTEGIRIDNVELEEIPSTLNIMASATSATVCEGQDIELQGTGPNGTAWNWSGPNGFSSNNQNTTVSGSDLPGTGNHDYNLTVTDSNNCTDSDVVAISVVSGFTATLLGGGDLCPESCTESGEHMEVGLSGGAEPYSVTFSVNGITIPFPFGFDIGDNTFQICHEDGGLFPDWDTGTDPVQIIIPDVIWQLSGGSIAIDIENITDSNGCIGTINGGSFDLNLAPTPSIQQPNLDPICLEANNTYDLTQHEADILNGGSGAVIWLDDDTDVTSAISNPSDYDIAGNNPVWAVVYDDPCYSDIIELEFDINLRPSFMQFNIEPLDFCGEELILPPFSNLVIIENENNPEYYLDSGLTDGPYQPNTIIDFPPGISSLIIYDEAAPNCNNQISIAINSNPQPEIISPSGSLSACGSIELPEPVIDNENDMVYEYNTEPDGSGIQYFEGDEIEESFGLDILYLLVTNEGGGIPCQDTAHIPLIFLGGTSYMASIPDQVCDTLFLPPITPPSPTVGYFTSATGGTRFQGGDTITHTSANAGTNVLDTLYLYDPTQSGACATIDTIVFEIGRTPILDVPVQPQFCDQGLLPPPSNINPNLEYATDRNFTNLINPVLPIIQSIQIYYRDSVAFVNGPGACYAQDSFFLEIIPAPNAGQDSSIVICELYNRDLDFFALLSNPDMNGTFTSTAALSFNNPMEVEVVNLTEGNYTVEYEINIPGCLPETSTVFIEVIPPANVGALTLLETCSNVGPLDLPFLFGNPDTGGTWFIADANQNELIIPDPSSWDISNLSDGDYRIIYSIEGTDDNPYCADRSSINTLTIVSDPYAGRDSLFTICQGYSELANFYELLRNPDQDGTFEIDGNPVDFEIVDPTAVDLSVLTEGTQEIFYTIEKPGCAVSNSTLTIEVTPSPALGVARNDTICSTAGIVVPSDYIMGNDPLFGFKVFDPNGVCVPNGPAPAWVFGGNIEPGVYEIVYTIMTDPNSSCEMPEGSFEITILESLNAGEDNVTTICRGQGINMNSLLSSDADINGTFLQDGFPVADPTNWIPVSLNDQVMVEYIVASTNNSCVSDTAFITVGISDELSAGVPSADNIVCESQTINLTNYLENETPGGQFYLSSDLSTNIEDVISLSEDTEFTYIIPAAPGCDADTSVFSLETTPDSEVMLALSKAEMCFDDEECIEAQISTNVDGLFEILISGGPLMTDINSISIVSSNGVLNLTLCPSINFDTPSMNSDTFFMGAGPVVQIDVNSIEGTPYDCQSKSLDLSQTLTILEDFQLAIDTTLCPGGFITVGGQDYFESTSIMEARSNGCDSIIHIDIDNFPQDSRDLEQDLCLGQVYTEIPGFSFEENIDTTIVLLGASSFGCDSTINLILNFTDKAVGPFDTQLCFGDSIEIDGVVFDADFTTGEVPSPTLSAFGCDSSTMVTVSFFDEVITGDFNTTLCPEDNFPLGDQVYDLSNSSGVSILQGEAVGGCDSMVNVVIDFYPESYDQIIDLCANDTIVIGNELFHAENTSGTISTNLNTVFGCDSVMNVTLNLTSLDSRDFTRALCDDMDFEFNGRTYNFSNPTGTEYIENTIGCDSVYNIEIIQLDTEETFIKIDLCTDQDTTINGILYNATNTMNASSLVAQNGCDSIVTVEVFVEEATVSIDSENLGNNTFQLSVVSDVPISEYNWSPASLLDCTICENPVASISQAELIEVSIVSEDGCIYSSEINLLPEDDQTTIDSTLRLYIPNSISTSDPLNNSFFIMSENELIMDALTIYDRWGNQVFSMVDFPTNDDALGWGENDRQNLEQGVYLYVLEFTDPVSGPQVLHGNITLLR